jgi:hypothetical protein
LDAGTDAQALHDADVDASDGRDGATAVIAAVHDAGTAAHDAGGADKRRDEITDTTPIQCEPGWMLGLLGIAVLLGFSERVFSGLSENLSRQFGDQTQTRAAPPPPRTPPAPPKDEPSTTRTNATPSADQKTTPQA